MSNYEMILKRGGRHDDIILDIYNVLLSGNNGVLNHFVEHSKDDREVRVDYTHRDLVSTSVKKYNNTVKQGR